MYNKFKVKPFIINGKIIKIGKKDYLYRIQNYSCSEIIHDLNVIIRGEYENYDFKKEEKVQNTIT